MGRDRLDAVERFVYGAALVGLDEALAQVDRRQAGHRHIIVQLRPHHIEQVEGPGRVGVAVSRVAARPKGASRHEHGELGPAAAGLAQSR